MLRRRDVRVDAGKAGSRYPLRMLYRLHETAGDAPLASPPRCCKLSTLSDSGGPQPTLATYALCLYVAAGIKHVDAL